MSDIFIVVDGQPDGPYTAEALHAKLATGELPRDTHASCEGDDQWVRLEDLIGPAPDRAELASGPP